mmetsp:Transcript_42473/g.89177  ORF Transcript_42473/g.89177 Transcript_42473/m.89177 type:complete len:237 (-) Transcript_42473:958-1668(-)
MSVQRHGLIKLVLEHVQIVQTIRLLVMMMPFIPCSGLELRRRCMLWETKQVIRRGKRQFHPHTHRAKGLGIVMIAEFFFPHASRIKFLLVQSTLFPSLALVQVLGASLFFAGGRLELPSLFARAVGIDGKSVLPVPYNFLSSVTIFLFVLPLFFFFVVAQVDVEFGQLALLLPLHGSLGWRPRGIAFLVASNFEVSEPACASDDHGRTVVSSTEEVNGERFQLQHQLPLLTPRRSI